MADAAALFPLYQEERGNASPESMESLADEIGAAKGSLDRLEGELNREERVVLDAVEGDIKEPLDTAADEPKRRASKVRAAGVVAAGAVRLFADGVRAYNKTVLELRKEYEERRKPEPSFDNTPAENIEALDSERHNQALIAELRKRQNAAREDHVDAAAQEAAGLLRLVEEG